jgi:hypothetical protein
VGGGHVGYVDNAGLRGARGLDSSTPRARLSLRLHGKYEVR